MDIKEKSNWELVFVLANIKAKSAIEAKHIAIVPFEDDRIQTLMNKSETTKKFLNGFIDTFGEKIEPASLIIEKGFFTEPVKIDILVNYRNIIAISYLSYAQSLIYYKVPIHSPLYSDNYDFYPVTLAKEGRLINENLAQESTWSEKKPFVGMSDKNVPYLTINEYNRDIELIEPLFKIWEEKYIEKKEKTEYDNTLFRSLETVYSAMSLPKKNFGSFYEIGVHISLYVSAMEILANPKVKDVNQSVVMDLLSEYKWKCEELDAKNYEITFSDTKKRKVNLIEFIYKKLYDSRNSFLHGSLIEPEILKPFGKDTYSIYDLAPTVYRTALFSYLVRGGYLSTEREELAYSEYLDKYLSKDTINLNYKKVLLTLLNIDKSGELDCNRD
jgi:hypothetical protein